LLQKEQTPAHSKLIADGLLIIDARLRFE